MTNVLRQQLLDMLEPVVNAMGYELVDIDVSAGRSSGLLRLYIDRSGGVDLDDCEKVSRQVSAVLDVEDPIPGHYVLEVSSPGLNRSLRTREHFERYAGSRVKVKLKSVLDGRKRFTGQLTAVDDEAITLQVDDRTFRLPLERIQKARLAPELSFEGRSTNS